MVQLISQIGTGDVSWRAWVRANLRLLAGSVASGSDLTALQAELDASQFDIADNTADIITVNGDLSTHIADTGNPHSVTKAQVGLGNADNTSDANKPVSSAQATAIAAADDAVVAALAAHIGDTGNPHSVTKTQVGLGSVDNTTDTAKPVSTATQTALNLKADINDQTFTGNPKAPTPTAGDNDTSIATTAFVANAVSAGIGAAIPVPGFKNLLINPYGQVSQRGAQPLAPLDDNYSHDRWYALTQTGSILSNTALDRADGTPCMWQLYQNQAAAQRMGYAQIIEGRNCKQLRGKSVTLGGKMVASGAMNIRYAILEWTGTIDAVVSDVVLTWTSGTYTINNFFINNASLTVRAVGSFAATTTLSQFTSLTATLGSTFNNLIILFWTEAAAAQNDWFECAPQFEEGAASSPIEVRSYGLDLDLCQRYYYQLGGASTVPRIYGYQAAGNFIIVPVPYHVQMRTIPTVAKGGTWVVSNCGQPGTSGISVDAFNMSIQVTATGVASAHPDSADDIFTCSAEL